MAEDPTMETSGQGGNESAIASDPGEVLRGLSPEQLGDVVSLVLEKRSEFRHAPVGQILNESIRGFITVDGFRDSSKAHNQQIKNALIKKAPEIPPLAYAILAVWIESHTPLRDSLAEFVGTDVEGADIAAFLQGNPDFAEKDTRLMWNCAPQWLTVDEPETRDDGPANLPPRSVEGSRAFDAVLESLSQLPPTGPEWGESIDWLVDRIYKLQGEKEEQLKGTQEAFRDAERIITAHRELLDFFEWDGSAKLLQRATLWADTAAARDILSSLETALIEFVPVRDSAETFAEENVRAQERLDVGARIIAILRELDALDILPEPDAIAEPGSERESAPDSPDEPEHLRKEIDGLREANNRLSQQNDVLREEIRVRDASIRELEEDKSLLEDDLKEAGDTASTWRQMYVNSQLAGDGADGTTRHFVSVADVLTAAEQELSGSLVFALNSRSDRSISFARPNDVWASLEWLATTYSQSKRGALQAPDLSDSLFKVSEFRYVPHQRKVTMGKYSSDYETTLGDRKFILEHHIGMGRGRGESAIRIAFAWDSERQMVIVGYVGRHQRTDAS